MGTGQFNEVYPWQLTAEIGNGDGLNHITLLNVGELAHRIDQLTLSNSDTVDHVVNLYVISTSAEAPVASVTVPAGAGYGGVAPFEVYPTFGPSTLGGLVVAGYSVLKAGVDVVMANATYLRFFVSGGTL